MLIDVKISTLEKGIIPIYELELDAVVERNIAAGWLHFSSDVVKGAQFGLLQFIVVGTPLSHDRSANLQYVLQVAKQIGNNINRDVVIIDKSTVPVGTADKVSAIIQKSLQERGANEHVSVTSNPEFLKEGAAIADFMRPDRIVIGSDYEYGIDIHLIPLVTQVNKVQESLLFQKVSRYFGELLSDKHIAVWGLAFKPNTDDLLEALWGKRG